MGNEAENFMGQVQDHLVAAGACGTLSVDEQDIVTDFLEQDFSAKRCAERIVDERE